jgi:hypothetical protein
LRERLKDFDFEEDALRCLENGFYLCRFWPVLKNFLTSL